MAVTEARRQQPWLPSGLVRLLDRFWLLPHVAAWFVTLSYLVVNVSGEEVVIEPVTRWYFAGGMALALLAMVIFFRAVGRAKAQVSPRSLSMAALATVWSLTWTIFAVGEELGAGTPYVLAGELVFWTTWDAVPLQVTKTLEWEQPVTGYPLTVGLVLVLIRAFVIFGVVRFVLGFLESVSTQRRAVRETGPDQPPAVGRLRLRDHWWFWMALILVAIALLGSLGTTNRVSVFDVGEGDCIEVEQAAGVVIDVPVLECAEPHTGEVVLVDPTHFAELDAFTSDEDLASSADGVCETEVEQFGVALPPPLQLGWIWLVPTEDSWSGGDRSLVCIATVLDTSAAVPQPIEVVGSVTDGSLAFPGAP